MKVLDILLENDYFEKGDITDLESLLSKFNQQEFEKIIIYKNKDYLAKNFTSQDQRNRWVSRITREIGIKSQRTNIRNTLPISGHMYGTFMEKIFLKTL